MPADQVQQQIQWAFKGLQKNLERIRRNIQVLRQLREGLTLHDRKGHFRLLNVTVFSCAGLIVDWFQIELKLRFA